MAAACVGSKITMPATIWRRMCVSECRYIIRARHRESRITHIQSWVCAECVNSCFSSDELYKYACKRTYFCFANNRNCLRKSGTI